MDELTEAATALLRRDGRRSFSELARDLGTNRQSIANRLTPLLESGDLRIIAAVHPRLLGLDVLGHLSLRVRGPLERTVERIVATSSSVFISETVGPHQLAVELHAHSLGDLQADVRTIRNGPEVVGADLLLYEHQLKSFFLGEEPGIDLPNLNHADLVILDMLQQDGRIGYSELAEAAGISTSGARMRMQRLLDAGVMKIGALGPRVSLPVFGIGICTSTRTPAMLQELRAHPGTEFLSRTVGRYDLVATITFSSLAEHAKLLTRLRAEADIQNVETWLHLRIHQERYQRRALQTGR